MAPAISRRPRVKIVRLAHAEGLPMPAYQSGDAAGLDLAAAVLEGAPITLVPGARAMIPTGLVVSLPRGFEAQVRPRSGLAARHGITVLNSPGTIDADYRGEVQVVLINHGDQPFTIARGERIAQLVVAPVVQAMLVETKAVSRTARGTGGFGSTGIRSVDAAKPAKKSKPPVRSGRVPKKTSFPRG
jgi:dUTP pyrophosphatase